MILNAVKLVLLSMLVVLIATGNFLIKKIFFQYLILFFLKVNCEESQTKELNVNELNQLRSLLGKYWADSEDSDELDDDYREKKSILLPRIGSAKRSPIVFPRIGYEKKRGYHMPRIGRNLNEDLYSQEQDYEKRAIHMPRIGRK